MKKLIYVFMIAAVFASCKKNTTNDVTPVEQKTQEVTFDINNILESADRAYSVPNCIPEIDNEENKYAVIVIEDGDGVLTTHYAEVYYVEGLPYTKALMLPVLDDEDDCDTYILREFYVYDNGGTAGYEDADRVDDQLFKAAPLDGSDFWDFAVNHVDYTFQVCDFEKTKILIDVLCFVPNDYELFGFFWFEITEITVRELCFFGDFCLKDTYTYDGTEYDESDGGVFIDEAAIFEIRARHQHGDGQLEDMVGSPFNNMEWLGVGEPLCIRYPDYDAEVDYYEFDLYLWAMVGSEMGWVYLYTYTWNDVFEDTFDPGVDGVYEFVVGNCVASETDMLFPPYMNLPQTATMTLGGQVNLGTLGGYWDMTLSNFFPAGTYDVPENVMLQAWCGDENTGIGSGSHQVDVFTTLDPSSMFPAGHHLTDLRMQKMNYLFNHYYTEGIDVFAPAGPSEAYDIQNSIWGVIHSSDGLAPYQPSGMSPTALSLSTAALQNGAGYSPLPGGNAGVLFFKEDPDQPGLYVAQLILVVVDP